MDRLTFSAPSPAKPDINITMCIRESGRHGPPRRFSMSLWIRSLLAAALLVAMAALAGCATGKALVTPLTVVRDTVDLPVVSVTNFFAWVAQSSGGPSAFAGPSWSLRSGLDFGASLNLAGLIFWTLSGVTGAVDYVACRSVYPNFPWGVSPWKRREESWWNIYFPNTRALWAKPKEKEKKKEGPPASIAARRPGLPRSAGILQCD